MVNHKQHINTYCYENNKEFGAVNRYPWLKRTRLFAFYSKLSYSQLRFNFFRRFFTKERALLTLDLGCGGGNELFKAYSKYVIGIDVSHYSCNNAGTIYDLSVQGDVACLPFRDQIFDNIVSLDLIGHIPHEDKASLLKEVHRVLKPLGKVALVIEVDGNNPLTRFGKKYPDLWQKYHIELDGHIGLEKPDDVIKRFENTGFNVVEVEKHYGLFFPTKGFLRRFDNEYIEKSTWIKAVVIFYRFIEKIKIFSLIFNFILGIIVKPLDHFSNVKRFSGLFIVVEKVI